ncbi:hypothetical protein QUC31_004930 [Theobroma cacao]
MIKCRLRASLHHQLTGDNGIVSGRKMIMPSTRQVSQSIFIRVCLLCILMVLYQFSRFNAVNFFVVVQID